MTNDEKLSMLISILGVSATEEESLEVYLSIAEREILAWRYSYASAKPATLPPEYEMTQIYAVVNGYSQSGAEGQTSHSENAISRVFKHEDMLAYIHSHVVPYCGVV